MPSDAAAMVLLLPGLYDSGPAHWQSLWQAQAATLPVQRVVQQDWASPRCRDWVERVSQVMQETTHDVVLVAHSSACAMVAHWAREAPLALIMRVRGVLLVAPSDPLSAVYPTGPMSRDIIAVVVGLVAWAAFAFWLHGLLIGVRPFGR